MSVTKMWLAIDWNARVLWATLTGRPINCGTMDGWYYP